jgi:hypothetical protein
MRLDNLEEDLISDGLTIEYVKSLKIKDFDFKVWCKDDKEEFKKIRDFIERHEWLGTIPQRVTHAFTAYHNDILCGVILMATPNTFSKILGDNTKKIEKLIARGAAKSWTPKNLSSYMVMQSIDYMVKNTEFRVFPAYSDVEAKELGTIYQACNFIYLGRTSGGNIQLFDPNNPHKGWFSDREARKLGAYRRFAKELDIEWCKEWNNKKNKVFWDLMPEHVAKAIKQKSKDYVASCKKRKLPPKHKYVCVRGKDKRETKELISRFLQQNPNLNYRTKDGRLIGKEYPKIRGD